MERFIRCNLKVDSQDKWPDAAKRFQPLPATVELPPGEYQFEYSYPLHTMARIKRQLGSSVSAIDILLYAAQDYKVIYDQEDLGSSTPSNPVGILINRATTNGPYGIWGHGIEDLYFEGILINTETRIISFLVGS